jgi:RHS repeat-associated protein
VAVLKTGTNQTTGGVVSWWNPGAYGQAAVKIKPTGGVKALNLFRHDDSAVVREYSGSIELGSTNHVVAWRYQNGTAKLTVDGTTQTQTQSPLGPIPPDWILMGASNGYGSDFNGDLSELAVIPRSISDSELARFNAYANTEWGPFTLCTPSCPGNVAGVADGCGGTCAGGQVGPGGPCSLTVDCQSGLACTNGTCQCPSGGACTAQCPCDSGGPCTASDQCNPGLACTNGTCGVCTSSCEGKACGASDGCGGTCRCGPGGVCDEDTDCNVELDCVDGSCTCVPQCDGVSCGMDDGCGGICGCGDELVCLRNSCVIPDCLQMPTIFGCGFPGATCGDTCTDNPACTSDQDCPTGLICPEESNGWKYGVAGQHICERPDCGPEDCGSINSDCGLCDCVPDCSTKSCGDADLSDGCGGRCPAVCVDGQSGCQRDSDCHAGSLCLSSVCRPADPCASPDLAPPDCGPNALCGPCAVSPFQSCLNRECGWDPTTGANCGSCPGNFFCNGASQCAPIDSTPPVVVPVPGGGTRTVTPPPAPNAAPIGAINAEFAVTDRGSAQYTIPIEVPPGRQLEPALALRYTSSTGNGALGVGWSLDGLSTITRCPRTFAQDGYSQAVTGTESDALCLDGQRLVLIGGEHMKCGAKYRTAVDTFDHVYFDTYSDSGCAPNVYKKDGRIFIYGDGPFQTRHSSWPLTRIQDRSGNFIRITYKNPIFDSAILTAGTSAMFRSREEVPASITYTGFGTVDGDREILFDYDEARPDKIVGYRPGGDFLSRTFRLTAIRVRAQNQLVRTYTLTHDFTKYPLYLKSIQECAGPTGLPCKPATNFDYYDELGFEAGEEVDFPLWHNGSPIPEILPYGIVHKEGSGPDRLTSLNVTTDVQLVQPLPGGVDLALNVVPVAGPWMSMVAGLIKMFGTEVDTSYTYHSQTFSFPSTNAIYHGVTDACNNGRSAPFQQLIYDPIFGHEKIHSSCLSKFPTGKFCMPEGPFGGGECGDVGTIPQTLVGYPRLWFVDVDGDGVQDQLGCIGEENLGFKLSRGYLSLNSGVPEEPGDYDGQTSDFGSLCQKKCNDSDEAECSERRPVSMVLDVDGDGTGNLVVFDDHLGRWAGLEFVGGSLQWREDWFSSVSFNPRKYYTVALDSNGDGLRDILALPDPDFNVIETLDAIESGAGFERPALLLLNNGTGFVEQRLFGNGRATEAPRLPAIAIDYDHDGIEELIEARDGSVSVNESPRPWRLRKIAGGTISWQDVPSLAAGPGIFGDFDSDGDLDALTQATMSFGPGISTRLPFMRHLGRDRRHGLLKKAVDGLGHQVDIDYSRTADSIAGRDCRWPQRCVSKLEVAVVKSHTESLVNGTQTQVQKNFAYAYHGALADIAGYGWLGFDKRTITVTDALGEPLGETTLTYKDPPLWTPSEMFLPYTYPTAGRLESMKTSLPAVAGNDFTSSIPLSTTTTFDWQQGTSRFDRPFAYLAGRQTRTQTDGVGGRSLHERLETFTPDDFGNITNETVVEHDLQGYLPPTPLAGSETLTTVSRDFQITQPLIDDWLISLPRSVVVTSTPRCTTAQECEARTQTRHTAITYYPERTLPWFVVREPGVLDLERSTELVRDEFGNVRESVAIDPTGLLRRSAITYDDRGLFPMKMSELGEDIELTTQVRYDDRFGTMVVQADPNGIDSTWSYDEFGALRLHRGPGGAQTVNYAGMTAYLTGDGLAIPAAYRITSTEVGGGHVDEDYNAFGQLVRRQSSGREATMVSEEFGYDHRQLLRRRSRPHLEGDMSQDFVEYDYDARNRLVLESYPNGGEVRYDYAVVSSDQTPPAWQVPGAIEAVRTRVKVNASQQNDAIQVNDRNGNPVNVVDALNQSTRYFYAAFGEIERVVDPAGRAIAYTHDAYGRLKTVTDAARGGTEVTVYNGHDEVIETQDPARIRSYVHDDLGRLVEIADPGGLTTFTYDGTGPNELGRLVETKGATGQITKYGYEPPTGTKNRGLMNRITQRLRDTAGGPVRELTTGYTFDPSLPRLERIDYPSSSSSAPYAVEYGFDTVGNPISATDSLGNIHWQVLETEHGYRIKKERLGSASCGTTQGTTTDRTYDNLTGRLNVIRTTCGSSTLQELAYAYDLAGNLTQRVDIHAGTAPEVFGYDPLNRLTTINGVTHYTYDSAEGRLHSQTGIGTYAYKAEGRDWLQTAGPYTYLHDAVGNVTDRSGAPVPGQSQHIDYTPFDLPSRVTSGGSGGPTVDFGYDAGERRVLKQTANAATFYSGNLYQRIEHTSGTTDDQFVIYAGGRAVAQATSVAGGAPSLTYLYEDVLGSVQTIANSSAAVQETRDYGPFGALRGPAVSSNVPYGFTGHETDADLGLVNMQGRIYDQAVGQFLQADPIIANPVSQGLNRYAYVDNSPLNFVDPSGFKSSFRDDIEEAIPGLYTIGVVGTMACVAGCGSAASGIAAGVGQAGSAIGNAAAAVGNVLSSAAGQAAAMGAGVASSLGNLAFMSQAGPSPTTTTAKLTMSSASSNGATPRISGNPVAPALEPRPAGTSLFDPERGALARLNCGSPERCRRMGMDLILGGGFMPGGVVVTGGQAAGGAIVRFFSWLASRFGARVLANQLPHLLAAESAAAARVGAQPIAATVQSLQKVANSGTLKWVVTEGGELMISPHTVKGVEISHAVLSGGKPVLAAGHAEIAAGGSKFVGLSINASSGHFGQGVVDVGKAAFSRLGVAF